MEAGLAAVVCGGLTGVPARPFTPPSPDGPYKDDSYTPSCSISMETPIRVSYAKAALRLARVPVKFLKDLLIANSVHKSG